MKKPLFMSDEAVGRLIQAEQKRQEATLNLIASENYTDPAIHAAQATVLSHKYAEGYPGKRYYSGCLYVDEIELLAQNRCKKLFKAEHANVQPLSGSTANLAAYHALLQPGDTILGMSLAHGGHLTHGHSVNISGKLYKAIQYGVCKETELIDYEQVKQLAYQHKPKLIIAGGSAYSRSIDFARFAAIAQEVGALFMADIAHIAGLVATDVHQSPIPYADIVTSTTHKTLRGPRGGIILGLEKHANAIDRALMPGTQGGPFMQQIAAKAICFQRALEPEFKLYQEQIVANARELARCIKNEGFRIVADGTDNHLFIVDLSKTGISGKEAEQRLEAVGITVSRSCIPFDQLPPALTSGIRLGTPALTTRGMKEADMAVVAQFIIQAIHTKETSAHAKIAQAVMSFATSFPLYPTSPHVFQTESAFLLQPE